MNDTQQLPGGETTPPPDEGFRTDRLRTLASVRRSRDDRLVGGVCAGVAKHLGIDPTVLRVVVAVFSVLGFGGFVLYAAAWFLLPPDDAEKSVAAEWFHLDRREESVRVAGLFVAAVIAIASLFGNDAGWWVVPWFLVVPGVVVWFLFVRPRQRRQWARASDPTTTDALPASTVATPTKAPRPRRRRSWALTWLTLCVAVITVAGLRIRAELEGPVELDVYLAAVLGVIALGLLVGTFFGHGGPLVLLGILVAAALAVTSLLPSARLGRQAPDPLTASDVRSSYVHGLGQVELDLTGVRDPDALLGRTVSVETGVGQTLVEVPDGLNVRVDARVDAGAVDALGRRADGTDLTLVSPAADPDAPALVLDLDQTLGEVKVVRR